MSLKNSKKTGMPTGANVLAVIQHILGGNETNRYLVRVEIFKD